ncbi:MAG: T9SS type A sorting domain-containing protein [Chitinophagales bacterium]
MNLKKLSLLLSAVLAFVNVYAQPCTYGTPDPTYWTGADDFYFGFTIDRDTTDVDTAYFTQGVDTTIFMQYLLPKKQAVTSPVTGTATVNSVQILGVAGLPIGLNYTPDSVAAANNNTYYPQDYRYGAVTICGETFATPGLKVLTVTVEGCGSLSGISQCQNQTFPLFIRVLPGSSAGVISMTPPNGCEEANINFAKQIPDPNPNLFTTEYEWDFAGLDSADGPTASYFFDSPGVYPITLTQTIYEYYISEVSVTLSGGWWGDVEEAFASQDPEPYMYVNAGGAADLVGLTSNNPSGRSRTWTGLDIAISDTSISFNAFDEDGRCPLVCSQDDDLGTAISSIIPTTSSPTTTYGFIHNNFTGAFKVNKRVLQTTEYKDTVTIYDLSTTTISAPDGLDLCQGDSLLLDAGPGFDYYQWFRDTTQLFGADSQTIKVGVPGNYYVEVLEPGNICPGFSDTVEVIIEPVSTPIINISTDGSFLYVNNPDSFQVQWYLDSVAIPGEESDTFETLGSAGPFTVSFTNDIGCEVFSAPFEQCVEGVADLLQIDPLSCNCSANDGQSYNVTSSGFALKSGSDLAWAISPVSDGLLETDAQVAAAADNELVFLSNSDGSFDLDACNLGDLAEGTYYLTPFAIEAVVQDTVVWDTLEGCRPRLEICPDIIGDQGWSINPLVFTFPNGNTVNINDEFAFGNSINQALWDIAGGICFPLTSLYLGNPNGEWKIQATNNGTGAVTVTLPPFNVFVSGDTCNLISQDQMINFDPLEITLNPGESKTVTITVPPLPADFPTVQASCRAFGQPIEFQYNGNCTSVENIEGKLETFNVYPNPNNGNFVVEFELMQPEQIHLSLYNATGQTIARESWNGVSGSYRKSYNFDNLPAGVYLIQLNTASEQMTKKVIIQ